MIQQLTPKSQIDAYIAKQIELKENVIIKELAYIGKECVNEAKTNPGYIDQTGNLRSSIGFMVLKNGSVIHQGGFEMVKEGAEKGVIEGKKFAGELIARNSKGLVLVLVAGMNYAVRVETELSRNVIMSGELLAEKLVPQLMKELGFTVR